MNREKNLRHLLDKRRLLLQRELKISIALLSRSQRSKNMPAHAKVRIPHMRTLLSSFKAECNPAKIIDCHAMDNPIVVSQAEMACLAAIRYTIGYAGNGAEVHEKGISWRKLLLTPMFES